MGRRAVAATLASVVIFTMMLVANAAVYSSENGYLASVRLSSVQVAEVDYATLLEGSSAYDSLAQTQSFLQSTPMDCSSWQSYLGSISGSATSGGTEQSVSYSSASSWSYASVPSSLPGTTLLASQFDGYSSGELNIEISTEVSETYLGGLPSYSAHDTQVVHLGVQPEAAAAGCLSALSDLKSVLSSTVSCNSSLVAEQVSQALARYPALSSYDAGASASLEGDGCFVNYWVRTSLVGAGVSGAFEWTVFGDGSLSTAVPPVPTPSSA